jgi:hypothetical protein
MNLGRSALPMFAALGLCLSGTARANPCEQEVADAAKKLDFENRQILAMELTNNAPEVQMLRREYNYRFMLFLQMQTQCNDAVRAERQGAAPAAGSAGCSKDTDCKGNRICVSGACVDP